MLTLEDAREKMRNYTDPDRPSYDELTAFAAALKADLVAFAKARFAATRFAGYGEFDAQCFDDHLCDALSDAMYEVSKECTE